MTNSRWQPISPPARACRPSSVRRSSVTGASTRAMAEGSASGIAVMGASHRLDDGPAHGLRALEAVGHAEKPAGDCLDPLAQLFHPLRRTGQLHPADLIVQHPEEEQRALVVGVDRAE